MTYEEALAYMRVYNSHSSPPPKTEKFFEAWSVINNRPPEEHREHPNYKQTPRDRIIAIRSRRYDVDAEAADSPPMTFEEGGPPFQRPGSTLTQFADKPSTDRLSTILDLGVTAQEFNGIEGAPSIQYWLGYLNHPLFNAGLLANAWNGYRAQYFREMSNWNKNSGALNQSAVPIHPDTRIRWHAYGGLR